MPCLYYIFAKISVVMKYLMRYLKKIGLQLEGFRDDRVEADYKKEWKRPHSLAMTTQKALKMANSILKSLDDLMLSSN